jgi:hypothetical protein
MPDHPVQAPGPDQNRSQNRVSVQGRCARRTPGVKLLRILGTRFRTGATGFCAGRPVLARCDRPVRRLIRRRVRRRRLCAGWARVFCSKWLLLPPDYKYPLTYLGEDKVAVQIISLPSFSLSSINELSKLEDLPFYPPKSKSLW